jgi:protein TonB
MNSLGMEYNYAQRDPARRAKGIAIVIVVHAVIGYVLASGMARTGLNILKKPMEAVVVQEVIIPPPPPPPPPPKEVRPPEQNAPVTEAPPPPVTPVVAPVVKIETPPPQQEAASPSPRAVVIEAPQPDAKAIAASMETEYAVKVRAMLNSTKRYPTGRKASQERPQGKVKVWFTLTRTGALVDTGVLLSSESNMLDDAALSTVRRGTYPAFPPNTWVGEEQHKFVAEMEFTPPSS